MFPGFIDCIIRINLLGISAILCHIYSVRSVIYLVISHVAVRFLFDSNQVLILSRAKSTTIPLGSQPESV